MIESILVSIGDAPHEKNAFEYAAHVAVLLKARLSCVFFHASRYEGPEDLSRRVVDETRTACAEYDLGCQVEASIGQHPTDALCEKAHSADLVVVGVPESIKTNGFRLIYDHIDNVLLRITKPIIVVHAQCTLLRRILAVHHGDSSSDRVLELATEIAERTGASLLGLALAETRPDATHIAQELKEYLQGHGLQPDVRDDLGFTVSKILDTAEDLEADLIGLSASHHGKLYEMIFQSVTETVAKLANRAVLVAR